jgi:hypothetical protein
MESKGRTKRRLTSQSPSIAPEPRHHNGAFLEATQLGRSSHLRFGPSVSADVLASPPPAVTGSDSVIFVGDKHGR